MEDDLGKRLPKFDAKRDEDFLLWCIRFEALLESHQLCVGVPCAVEPIVQTFRTCERDPNRDTARVLNRKRDVGLPLHYTTPTSRKPPGSQPTIKLSELHSQAIHQRNNPSKH